MRVLLLSPYPHPLLDAFEKDDLDLVMHNGKMRPLPSQYDWIVCYGYRRILRGKILDDYRNRIINLHIGLLPWNRGSHPIVWAAYEGTYQGVSIHLVNAGIDTGNLLVQSRIDIDSKTTLARARRQALEYIEGMFIRSWPTIRMGTTSGRQGDGGSFHRKSDLDPIFPKFSKGWETTIGEVAELGRKARGEA